MSISSLSAAETYCRNCPYRFEKVCAIQKRRRALKRKTVVWRMGLLMTGQSHAAIAPTNHDASAPARRSQNPGPKTLRGRLVLLLCAAGYNIAARMRPSAGMFPSDADRMKSQDLFWISSPVFLSRALLPRVLN